ncbi:hypothetical protein SARC_17044, partial [Sphaeroforma arctica JP610]
MAQVAFMPFEAFQTLQQHFTLHTPVLRGRPFAFSLDERASRGTKHQFANFMQ